MLSASTVVVAGLVWVLLLFAVALYGERRADRFARLWPAIYALSLAVYCTAWTFYGTVTQAARWNTPIPPTFIGTILLFLFALPFLGRLAALAQAQNSASLADLIASRFGKDPRLAAWITVVAVLGMVPYVALQLKAVAMSFAMLTGGAAQAPAWQDAAFWIAVVMALFAMLFGTRRAAATEHNRGLVLAVAFESLIKLAAMLAVGVFAVFGMNDGLGALAARIPAAFEGRPDSGFFALVALGAVAMFTLPHQFHLGIVELRERRHLRTARWLFPLYLLLIAAPILPLAWAGRAAFGDLVPSDLYVLALPLSEGHHALALLTFLGGVSAATGMVILVALTLSIMISNHWFAPRVVRTSRRKAGLSTDASYRFERGIDSAGVAEVLALGAALLAQVGGGRVETTMLVGAVPAARASVTLRPSRVALLLGERVPAAEITALLGGIGFVVTPSGEALTVTPPSWRHDVTREVDLIEEVARLRGFDRLPDALQGARPGTVPDHPLFTTYRRVRDALVAEGLLEVRPLPFTSGRVPGRDALEADLVRVINPLGDDEPFLRRSVLETLARRAEYNLNRMQGDVRLFEVGTVFQAQGTALPREEQRVGVLLMGRRRPVHFTEPQPPAFDEWDAQSLAARLGAAAFPGATIALVPAEEPYLWKVQAGGVTVGEVRRLALDAPVWAKPAFGIEIALGVISSAMVAGRGAHAHATAPERPRPAAPVRYTALPTTPAAEFDLALLVPDAVSAGQVEALIRSVSGTQLERCELFDQFRGAGVPDGARSLAWRLTFRHPERTLRDKEIEGRRVQLLKTLEAQLGVRPRTA